MQKGKFHENPLFQFENANVKRVQLNEVKRTAQILVYTFASHREKVHTPE